MTEKQQAYETAMYDIDKILETIEEFADKHKSILHKNHSKTFVDFKSNFLSIHRWLEQKRDFHETEDALVANAKHLLDNRYSKEQIVKIVEEAVDKGSFYND